jgi:hypothetical protein
LIGHRRVFEASEIRSLQVRPRTPGDCAGTSGNLLKAQIDLEIAIGFTVVAAKRRMLRRGCLRRGLVVTALSRPAKRTCQLRDECEGQYGVSAACPNSQMFYWRRCAIRDGNARRFSKDGLLRVGPGHRPGAPSSEHGCSDGSGVSSGAGWASGAGSGSAARFGFVAAADGAFDCD